MWIIAGLGNPGDEYHNHRHNIGFRAVDAIHDAHPKFGLWKEKFQGEIAKADIGDNKILLLKPQTFMNLSGQSLQAAAKFYKVPTDQIIVIHDELDLEPGKCRIKHGGGHGGHNGLRSIDQHLGKEYHRVRIGIGHPGDKNQVHGYVLQNFAKKDDIWITPLIKTLAEHITLMLDSDDAGLMNKIDLAVKAATADE